MAKDDWPPKPDIVARMEAKHDRILTYEELAARLESAKRHEGTLHGMILDQSRIITNLAEQQGDDGRTIAALREHVLEMTTRMTELVQENAALRERILDLQEALLDREWASDSFGIGRCNSCGALISDGHAPDCPIPALLEAMP